MGKRIGVLGIIGFVAFVGSLLMLLILVPLALGLAAQPGAACTTPSPQTNAGGSGGKGGHYSGPAPNKFIPMYQGAAKKFNLGSQGASMLEGIHYAETDFSTNVATTGPYVGPMAIGSAYWNQFGQDGDGDGKKDIMNEADAIYAAADILHSYGAPKDWHTVLADYNAGPGNVSAGYAYADKVMAFAKKYPVPSIAMAPGNVAVAAGTSQNSCGGSTGSAGGGATGNCDATRVEYLPQYTLSEFAKIFGAPRSSDLTSHLTNVDFLGTSVQAHDLVSPCLQAVAADWKSQNINYKVRMMGCYRASDGGGTGHIGDASYHVYGAACDINWDTNPYGGAAHDMPPEVVKIFRDHGFLWGGDYQSATKDWMHFEWHGVKP